VPAGRLLFVPHLGGRILPSAPEARGAWVGLDLSQTRGDLARAVLESVAFEYAGFLERTLELFPDLVPRDVRVIGGGGADALWNRIKASALGLPYVRLKRESFSCWGAAMVAAAAVGAVDDLAATALTPPPRQAASCPTPPCSRFTTGAKVTIGPSSICSFRHTMRCTHEKSVPARRGRRRARGDGACTQCRRVDPRY